MDNNKEMENYHALYTFLVTRFWICIAHHHVSLYMMQQHKQKKRGFYIISSGFSRLVWE